MSLLPKGDSIHIREVWNDNLEQEFKLIREVVDEYPYVAMDTEFPGVMVHRVTRVGDSKTSEDRYLEIKDNVDMLKLIQVGLTLADEKGNLPMCGTNKYCIWQFNFREFNPDVDPSAEDSLELLKQSGIDFRRNNAEGVGAKHFGELLMSSGVVLNESVSWVTFHSAYDFGYLVKLLTGKNLPDTQKEFYQLVNVYFPVVYDLKHMTRFCNGLHGGLNKLAGMLGVERVGVAHQAGSDSLLTSSTFRKLVDIFFKGPLDKYSGVVYGVGDDD